MKLLILLEGTLPLIFWVLLIFGFDAPYVAILTIATALIHEIGHLAAIYTVKKEYKSTPRADISGFRIEVRNLSYKEEMICALAGPLINLVLGILLLLLFDSEYALVFSALNIMTALSNLLPVRGYDGYKFALSCASLYSDNPARVELILERFSFFFSAVMCFLSLYFILKIGEGYWIFAVFFSFLLAEILKRQKHTFFEKNRDFERF